jgi:TorA maturation chaperone TorD
MIASVHKAEICRVFAWLLSPPEQELLDCLVSGEIHEVLFDYFSNSDYGPDLSHFETEKCLEFTIDGISSLYNKYFDNPASQKLYLIESVYKSWTLDPECKLLMAREKGYLFGDPALHMLELYKHFGLKLPDKFQGIPDHLVLELEFLACLYENCSDDEVRQFVNDHLDWLPDLKEKALECDIPDFYIAILDIVNGFLQNETGGDKCVKL